MQSERLSASSRKRKTAKMRERMRNRKVMNILLCFIAIVLAFLLGFAVRSNVAFMHTLGFAGDEIDPSDAAARDVKTPYNAVSARIGEVEDILDTYSVDSLDLSKATKSMLGDLILATNDPYAQYFDSNRYENYVKESADKNYAGIGVLFGEYGGRAYATDVFTGSEADARGVEQGDFVVAIDGDSSHDWSVAEVVGAIKADDGENVTITWMRPMSIDASTGTQFTTTLACKRYDQTNIDYSLQGDVGYIKIRQNTSDSASLVKRAVEDLVSQGAKAFVLDVRDNPGGYLTQSLDMASLFVPSGILVSIETNDGTSIRNASGETITTLPVVLLINQYTAASAEVFVAALQDNQRSMSVGQPTMGKGSVQVVRELSFGGAVKYTAAYYLTPLGHSLDEAGISPDIAVANTPGEEGDSQLAAALDSARALIAQS